MSKPFHAGIVKKKPQEVKLTPCGLAYTFWCPCGAFQIALVDEISFGEAKCSSCGQKSLLDTDNASGRTPERNPEKKTREYVKSADKAQELLG